MEVRRQRLVRAGVLASMAVASITMTVLLVDAARAASIVTGLTASDPGLTLADPFRAATLVLALVLVAGVALGSLLFRRTRRLLFGAIALWTGAASLGLVAWVAPLGDLLHEWAIAPLGPPTQPLAILALVACLACLAGSLYGYEMTPAAGWLAVTPPAGTVVTTAPHRS